MGLNIYNNVDAYHHSTTSWDVYMLKKKLLIIERQLVSKLDEIRITYSHRVDKGSIAESIFRDFLREYLPPSNRIGEGEIFDTLENISTQLDVIITN